MNYANETRGQMHGGSAMAQSASVGYGVDTAARQLEVPGAVNRLENAVSNAADLIDRLDGRLTGYIARSNPPQPAEIGKGQQIRGVIQSGLGSQIDTLAERVEMMASRVRDLTERLEA